MITGRKAKARHMVDTETFRQFFDDEEVGAHRFGRLHQFRTKQNVVLAAGAVDVVMFKEHGGRQHDIGHLSRFGHELLMHGDEEIVAQETLFHQPLFGRDIDGIGILYQQRRHRAAVAQRFRVPVSTRPICDWSSLAYLGVGVRTAHQAPTC